ncbi:MAG: helicase-associated domain-containing protein [Candidatus Hydrogenedentota bacterium]
MRHSANMIVSMEGINRAVYSIAYELSQNSRSGLTVRFLSKKLEIPQEEVEYLVDVNHKLLYTDLTKIRLPNEGMTAVKRITDGLENHGDIPSLFQTLKRLSSHDYRRLEEQIGVDLGTKKATGEHIIENFYRHPDSVMQYVATHGFSETAREVFDIVWQSKDGIMPVSKIRAAHGGTEFDVEQALWELFRGIAAFEMFRYDAEDRLVRMAGLLTELRQWRSDQTSKKKKSKGLKPLKGSPGTAYNRELQLTEKLCQLVATVAAKPVRLRGDGELFKEDLRRLSDTVPEDSAPSLTASLWAAEGVGWLVRHDNELHAGELEDLIKVDYVDRHKNVFDWLTATGDEPVSSSLIVESLENLKPKAWYKIEDFIEHCINIHEQLDPPILKLQNGSHQYLSSGTASNIGELLERSMEESLHWLGVIERSSDGFDDYMRITPLGEALLLNKDLAPLKTQYVKANREIIVQPNFDIVVPTQDMDTLLTVPLDQFTVRQSTGQATVYLMTKEAFTQALQEGHDGDAFVDFLLAYNRNGVLPPNVMTTLEDWRGGLRRVRITTIDVLEIDDHLVMADLQHRRKFNKFLTPLDPDKYILYHDTNTSELGKQLEKDGFIVELDND